MESYAEAIGETKRGAGISPGSADAGASKSRGVSSWELERIAANGLEVALIAVM